MDKINWNEAINVGASSPVTEEDQQKCNAVLTQIKQYVEGKGFRFVVDSLTEIETYRKVRIYKVVSGFNQVDVDVRISVIDAGWGDLGWQKYADRWMQQIDTQIKKDFAECSSPTRDTQFAGFAELLWKELIATDAERYGDQQRELIAQRAYDLVKHTTSYIGDCVANVFASVDEVVGMIPDLVEWPEQEK